MEGKEGGREGGGVRLYVSLEHARRARLSIRRSRPTLSLSPFLPLSGYNDHFCRFDGTNNLIDMGEIPLLGPQDAVPECWFNCQVKREGEDVQLCPSCFSFFALHPSRFSSVFSRFCLSLPVCSLHPLNWHASQGHPLSPFSSFPRSFPWRPVPHSSFDPFLRPHSLSLPCPARWRLATHGNFPTTRSKKNAWLLFKGGGFFGKQQKARAVVPLMRFLEC